MHEIKITIKKWFVMFVVVIVCLIIFLFAADFFLKNEGAYDNAAFYSGYIIETDSDYFLYTNGPSTLLPNNEIVRMKPADDSVSFASFSTGDLVSVKIITVGTLEPLVADIYEVKLLEKGDSSNIGEYVIRKLSKYGYKLKDTRR